MFLFTCLLSIALTINENLCLVYRRCKRKTVLLFYKYLNLINLKILTGFGSVNSSMDLNLSASMKSL